ncbi:MAG: arginine--tRNA ligase [Oscillospiraceae bacterium]|nr:arginine--tRNA ligase [Oscillospiraceae bacterium]
MSILKETIEILKIFLRKAINSAIESGDLPEISGVIPEIYFEFPTNRKHGELSSNIAMISAKLFKISPEKISQKIVAQCLNLGLPSLICKCESAGVGFINFYLSNKFYSDVLIEIEKKGLRYGFSDFSSVCAIDEKGFREGGSGVKNVLLEFVSANPTGPMHMGNARLGAIGDCLAEILKACNFDVCKEFYVNDTGNQIEKFGDSLFARFKQIFNKDFPFPEDGYHGEDIKVLAGEFLKINGDKILSVSEEHLKKMLIDYALPKNIEKMKKDLKKYGIIYDSWFYESRLHENGSVKEVVDKLTKGGLTYKKDEAIWFSSVNFGAEKDEVLVRRNGTASYFLSDIAYHVDKFSRRKFGVCINIWGADHHGHVTRMHAALKAFGIDPERLKIIIVQHVHLVRDGKTDRMSKRSGNLVNLSDFLDEVNKDSARFIFNMQDSNSKMEFDLENAIKSDLSNPVYYVQYAHARIESIMNSAHKLDFLNPQLDLLDSVQERELIFYLGTFEYKIMDSAKTLSPEKITGYAMELSALFHKFYNFNKVLCEEKTLAKSRLFLCKQTLCVLKNVLKMLKVTAPERMETS